MRINNILFTVLLFSTLHSKSQTVTPVLVNVAQMVKYEEAHPELFRKCATCPRKEVDGGWKNIAEGLPIPVGAIIKTQQQQSQSRPQTPATPLNPLVPSPVPNQTFLGHVDPGQGIPPDTHGAVGINHVITATNDFVRIHAKNGTVISTVSITSFAGVANTCDPYIKFDPVAQRFFYSAIDCSGDNGNKVAILVSQTSDATGNWFRYTFTPNVASGAFFLDHPYLGFNEKWLVLSGRKFTATTSFSGSVLFVFDKAVLLANLPVNFGTNAQAIEKTATDGDAPLPVSVYGANPNPGTFYILQNWNGASSAIRLSTVTGNIPNATWNTTAPNAVFAVGGSPWTSSPGNIAAQQGEARKIATNDARISTGIMINGNIWCAQHIGITNNNVAVQWWQLNGAAGSNFGNVLQRGRIGDGLTNNYRWFPGIAVNQNEDVIIGYTFSSNISSISSAYSFRTNTTPLNTTNQENIYKLGLSTYYKDFGGSRARWGDYSHSALDPVDGSLWTIQEYADQRTGAADNDSRYGVWWAQVVPTSTLLNKDASIGAISEPRNGVVCKVPVSPIITIRNLGKDTLRSVQVGIILDGVAPGTLININNLAIASFNNSAPINITPAFTAVPGPHTLKVFTTNPNGGADVRPSNDTTTVNFTIAPSLVLPYTESFEAAAFPPANGSAIINADAPEITWQKTTLAGSPGNNSISINCFNYQPDANNKKGQRDIYHLPYINVAVLDSLAITFNVAYRQYSGTGVSIPVVDSLRLIYSPDCGNTWYPTSYYKGGTDLASVNTTTSTSFVPTANQWRTDKVILKDFCSSGLTSIMIGFEAVNGYGNNIYLDSINIVGYNSFARNAVVQSITHPLPALCTTSFTPKISFANQGQDTIKTLKINYQVDNGSLLTVNWAGNLAKCDSVTISLAAATATVGTHTLKVFTALPNGQQDQATSNDTLTKIFSIYTTAPTPILEEFETTNIPNANWGIQNVNGGTTWQKSVQAAKNGSGSLVLNNADATNTTGAVDYFITPIVLNSAGFDSVFINFDLAYKAGPQYPGSTVFPVDTLELLATSNCGQTFTPIWKKWGNELQTVNEPNLTNTSAFVPANATEWSSKRIYLTPLVGAGNFQIYFAAKGNKQNNIWLDNISITAQTLPQRLKNQGYLIYPNPFNSSFIIHHSAVEPPITLKAAQVFNAAGLLVWDRRYNSNAARQITVDLKNMAQGVYILKMMYTNKIVVERLVKN